MKTRLTLLFTFVLFAAASFAQSGPKEVTPAALQKIKAEVEKSIPAYKASLQQKDYTENEIEFSIDTFRISQTASKRMDIDYSTVGMNEAIGETTAAYDRLLNKYYSKLLKLLKPEDKKVLITAQKAWLQFRDAEFKLIDTMSEDVYSGGGTIQSIIMMEAYNRLVVKRTIDLFDYFNNAGAY